MDRFYTVSDVAGLLSRSPRSIRNYIRSGDLPAHNIGQGPSRPRYLIAENAVTAFLAARAVHAAELEERPQ
jgi:Helix-turn-helix domain